MKKLLGIILLFATSWAHAEFLNAPKDSEYALVMVLPSQDGLTTEQKQVMGKAKDWIQDSLPAVLKSLAAVLTSSQGSKDIFLNSTTEMKESLMAKLADVHDQLPENYLHMQAYFIAWPKKGLKKAKTHPQLDFPVLVFDQVPQMTAVYSQINSSVAQTIGANYANGDRFQFTAAALKLRLERKTSILTMQIYGALNPGESEFIENGDEVELSKLVIPGAQRQSGEIVPYAPTALLTIRQILQTEVPPSMDLDFGTYGGVAGDIASANGYSAQGELQIFRDDISMGGQGDCSLKKATPTLSGALGPKATGLSIIDDLAKGRDVQFRIFSAHMDMAAHQVQSLDVRMDLGLLQCLSLESVKQKFKDKANAAIESKLNSLSRQDDLTDKLMDQLYCIKTKQN